MATPIINVNVTIVIIIVRREVVVIIIVIIIEIGIEIDELIKEGKEKKLIKNCAYKRTNKK